MKIIPTMTDKQYKAKLTGLIAGGLTISDFLTANSSLDETIELKAVV